MAWRNVFDIGECDVFVRYQSAGSQTDPTWDVLVRAADLLPAIGTVSVVGNQVVCDFSAGSGSGGTQPEIVVVPRYDASASTGARVTESSVVDQAGAVSYTANVGALASSGGLPETFTFTAAATANMLDASGASVDAPYTKGASVGTIGQGLAAGQGISVNLQSQGF